jgi:hypothetical protein
MFCQRSFGVFLNLAEGGRTFKSRLAKQEESTRAILGEGDELSRPIFLRSGLNRVFFCGSLTNGLESGIFHLLVEYHGLKNKEDTPQAHSCWK